MILSIVGESGKELFQRDCVEIRKAPEYVKHRTTIDDFIWAIFN